MSNVILIAFIAGKPKPLHLTTESIGEWAAVKKETIPLT